MPLTIDGLLGTVYVTAWSVSMYPPIITNCRLRSSKGISFDFIMLNSVGYFYLVCSLFLQYFFWDDLEAVGEKLVEKPKVSGFDLWYCMHGFVLNLVLWSQVRYPAQLWHFDYSTTYRKMKPGYSRLLCGSLACFALMTVNFIYGGPWDNKRMLQYCNQLFLLKISMSLVKYIPQVVYNFDRKTMVGFAIQGVFLDVTGGVASLGQLFYQLARDKDGLSLDILLTNFGKIGLGLVTLVFNFIFISQWFIYDYSKRKSIPLPLSKETDQLKG
ncbi:hypothetical protein NCAS_0D04630 [Naumovozyma castellii]|uniref:Uncharacterized protein n=1 Tax=Naumovozyma castellii TaxID=27288 RepID=G0VEQ3_NAUCA|nr:hypothetical protein NCAS_0D04630 [Naumovozyma castellii CBS 4309]CCC70044.1 hypothetical protein NCAS_0D04630 [Naumovozyma castellii CBS 4309]